MTAQELFEKNKELLSEDKAKGASALIDDFGNDFVRSLKLLVKESDEKWNQLMLLIKEEFGKNTRIKVNLFLLRQQAWENMEGEQMIDALRGMFE